MTGRRLATVVLGFGAALAFPATGAALTFARTDYPLPSLGIRLSDIGPAHYDDGPVALIDLNNDGKLDIVIADYGTGRVHVLLNQGAGTFAPASGSPFAACENNLEADDIVAGQLNPQTDQNPDVAVVCEGQGAIVRLLGNGSGSLGPQEVFFTGAGSGGVGAPLKLAHLSETSGRDYLYGSGAGYACFLPVRSGVGTGTTTCDGEVSGNQLTPVHWYDAACFGGDQVLSFSKNAGQFLGWGLNPRESSSENCSAPFQSSERNSGIAAGSNSTAIAAGDLNGDGEPDVVMADDSGAFHVVAWQGGSTSIEGGIPSTDQPSNFTSAGAIDSLGVADFNGDGCSDIAAAVVLPPPSGKDAVAIHSGHCNTTQFDAAQTFEVAGDVNTYSDLTKMTVGDLNGDGRPDIVTTGGYAGAATVLLNTTPAAAGSGGGTGGAANGGISGGAAGGGTGGSGGGGAATIAAVGKVTISPSAFPAAPSGPSALAAKRRYGTKVSYTLNEAASVLFTVVHPQPGRKAGGGRCVKPTRANRRARKCTRLVAIRGSFMRAGSAGGNSFRFTGRLAGLKLKPGEYQLVATPSAGGRSGRARSASFRIIK
jgi:FG-GAP-like repeat/FG-GAP repeat